MPLVGASPQPTQTRGGFAPSSPTPTRRWNYEETILYPPPRLAQREIYKGEEGTFGCWATTAEMIVRWRNESAPFKRPSFFDMIPGTDVKARGKYMDYVNQCLVDWRFQRIPGAALAVYHAPGSAPFRIEDVPGFVGRDPALVTFDEWTAPLIATQLNSHGPLYCVGSFWRDAEHNKQVG